MSITLQIAQQEGEDVVTYVGPINEDAEMHLAGLLEKIGKKVRFNFKQVEYVNSCGIRAWINFMRDLEAKADIVFEECTDDMVMQFNMIPNFKGKAKVQSVYASFGCESCGHYQSILFEEGKNLPADPNNVEIPDVQCEKCGSEMEMDELESEFFAFLAA